VQRIYFLSPDLFLARLRSPGFLQSFSCFHFVLGTSILLFPSNSFSEANVVQPQEFVIYLSVIFVWSRCYPGNFIAVNFQNGFPYHNMPAVAPWPGCALSFRILYSPELLWTGFLLSFPHFCWGLLRPVAPQISMAFLDWRIVDNAQHFTVMAAFPSFIPLHWLKFTLSLDYQHARPW